MSETVSTYQNVDTLAVQAVIIICVVVGKGAMYNTSEQEQPCCMKILLLFYEPPQMFGSVQ
jgi:hypothetical protein